MMNVCKERGIECDLATGLGFCSVTGCRKQNRVSNISIIPTVMVTDAPMVEYASVVRCKDCKYKPSWREGVKEEFRDGFELIFPDWRDNPCPCQCDDGFYAHMPDDNWFCANGEEKNDD